MAEIEEIKMSLNIQAIHKKKKFCEKKKKW